MGDKASIESLKTYYAPEVEERLVSLVWHMPEALGRVLRELDPEIHFVQPHLRHILKAVRLSYSELGACDWTTVVQVLREQKLLEEAGNLELLDQVWRNEGYGTLLDYYIELLKDYAEQRSTDPTQPVFRFTGGKGRIIPNRLARRDTDPSDVGEAFICGQRYRIRGWRDGEGLDIKFYPERK